MHSLIIFADLERALRQESSIAVALAWGISRITVWKCRQAMGLKGSTQGTTARRHDVTDSVLHLSRDESGRVARARRGAQKEREKSQRSNGDSIAMWEPEIVELLGVSSDREIARRIGCATLLVARERGRRGIAPLNWGGARQSDLCSIDGDRVADRRRALDLTQNQIGAKIERAQGYISQVERGKYRRIPRQTLEALAHALECQPDDLRPLNAATPPDVAESDA